MDGRAVMAFGADAVRQSEITAECIFAFLKKQVAEHETHYGDIKLTLVSVNNCQSK